MKQSEMLATLKELSSELNRYAAGSDSIVPGAYAEALDAAIETLDRIRWRKVEDELPSGYTELEYIESSGTQYVDTGVVPNNKGEVLYIDKNRIEAAVTTLRRRTERGEERN